MELAHIDDKSNKLKFSAPVFPPELERLIFEICAWSRPASIRCLILVAWRVKTWVEPHLYRTIAVTHSQPMAGYPISTPRSLLFAIRHKPATFFRDNVRNLVLHEVPRYAVKTIFSVCTQVENLCISGLADDPDQTSFIAPLSPKRLYADIRPLFWILPPAHPFFSQITHLELSRPEEAPNTMGIWLRLSGIPHLTHLSFQSQSFIPICSRLLQDCKSLSVLVSLDVEALRHFWAPYEAVLAQDPRFVVMRCGYLLKDWQRGVHTGIDYWSRAEDFIAKRWTGEVDALQYEIPHDESEWIA
ncbi:hypothetical protein C8R44DRAFT_745043 [Mycena epipterygia]|nr:hypothetical protein C8R44DRAFT_745043 [Mycena epipterygia]